MNDRTVERIIYEKAFRSTFYIGIIGGKCYSLLCHNYLLYGLICEKCGFCFETVMSTDRNFKLLRRAKEKGYFIRCYILTADPMINICRVRSRVAEGGHDVPEEKIVKRYDRALSLVKDVVAVCDVCHIYDNSEIQSFGIFKKRKEQCFYSECEDWLKKDIELLTGISEMQETDLNI